MSVDISLYNGDFAITKSGVEGESYSYDILLEDSPNSSANLLRRSVITPPKWIANWAIEEKGIVQLDAQYGDDLYLQLSDPLTYNWISDAYSNVRRALSYIDDPLLSINSVSIAVDSSDGESSDTANVFIDYSIKGQSLTTEVSIGEIRNET
jgi:hypothetical protein